MAKRDYYEILGVDRNASKEELKKSIRGFKIVGILQQDIETALDQNEFTDLEDAFQYFSGSRVAKIIVTRNKADYPAKGEIEILTPEEFLKKYSQ